MAVGFVFAHVETVGYEIAVGTKVAPVVGHTAVVQIGVAVGEAVSVAAVVSKTAVFHVATRIVAAKSSRLALLSST